MVRAKLAGPWEGGGVGGKNIQTNNFLRRGLISTTSPVPLGNRVNLERLVTMFLYDFSSWIPEDLQRKFELTT